MQIAPPVAHVFSTLALSAGLLGLHCLSLRQTERRSQNRINQSSDGSRRPPGSWRRTLMANSRQHWPSPAHVPVLASRICTFHCSQSLGWTLSLSCRCGRQLDMFGHYRAACAVAGVLGRRGYPLECAAAQVQRGWGTGVHQRSRQRHGPPDLNGIDGQTSRGLRTFQLAIDTTLVSPLHSDGSARRTITVQHWNGSARTLNLLGKGVGHGWLFWQPKLADGGAKLSSQPWPGAC